MTRHSLDESRVANQAYLWNRIAASFPEPHVLQSWEWGQSKIRNGWQPFHLLWEAGGDSYSVDRYSTSAERSQQPALDNQRPENPESKIVAAALVLQRTVSVRGIAPRLSVMYVPKGPLLRDWGDQTLRQRLLDDLAGFARRQGAIFIKIDPDVRLGSGIPGESDSVQNPLGEDVTTELGAGGWIFSPEQVQYRNTVMLDLTPSEEEMLSRMKQKTRYNVRLAQRKGLTIRNGSTADMELLYHMYAETAQRDGFVIRDFEYYRDLWSRFIPHVNANAGDIPLGSAGSQPEADALIAEVDGDPAAAVLVFRFARHAWYLFGMSRSKHREKMPNALLQWEAIRRAKAAGCITYDLWGAPDEFHERDPMWGVWRFKEGLGGQVVRHIGAWDLPVHPIFYRLYTQVLPRLLSLMRRRARALTRQRTGE